MQLKLVCFFVGLSLWATVFSQALFYQTFPRTILLTLLPKDFPFLGKLTGGIYVYKEGLTYGLVQGLRLASTLALGLLICFTTEPKDILLALMALKVPYVLSFMVMTALRFIPLLSEEFMQVIMAQHSKGFEPFKFQNLPKIPFVLLTPVLANALRRSYTLAAAAYSRGFSLLESPKFLPCLRIKWTERLIGISVLSFALIIVAIKLLYFLYIQEIFYYPAWEWIYGLGKNL